MTNLTPILAFDQTESALSFAARTAAFHTGGGVLPFLRDIGIAPMALVSGEPGAIERLCEVTGADVVSVTANAAIRTGKREYLLRGETFSAEFFVRPRVSFCPACMISDDTRHPDPAVARRHRWFWALLVVRTCPVHGISMIRLAKENHDDELMQLASRVPEHGDGLVDMIASQNVRPVSRLQRYIVDRLDGASGPAWLDEQTIEQAQWATEMLGAVLAYGSNITLDSLTEEKWDEAGRVGMAYTDQGPEGVRRALEAIFAGATYSGSRPGPQKVFGPLYTSLAAKRAVKDRGPITALLREFIFDHFTLEAGTSILGEVLPARRRHSAASLAKEAGLETRLVSNALISAGLIRRDKASLHMTVDAEEGRRIAAKIHRAVYFKELPSALNTTRNVVRQILDDQILKPIADRSVKTRGHTSKAVDRSDVVEFLAQITQLVPAVSVAPDGYVPLLKAAEKTKTRAGNILHLLLAGALTKSVRINGDEGIAALRFDPDEIKPLVRKIESVGPSPAEAAGELRVPIETTMKLAEAPDATIKIKTVSARTNHRIPRVSSEQLLQFRRTFTSLPPMAEAFDMRCPDLGRALRGQGITPAFKWAEFGADIYRRRDLLRFRPS